MQFEENESTCQNSFYQYRRFSFIYKWTEVKLHVFLLWEKTNLSKNFLFKLLFDLFQEFSTNHSSLLELD